MILAWVFLPVMFGLERLAFYGMRSIVWIWATQAMGRSHVEWSTTFSIFTWATALTPLLGGALAIAIGPRWVMPIGAAIAGAGLTFLPLTNQAHLAVPLVIYALGVGLVRPCIFAALAEALPDPRESARLSLAVVIYFAVNSAASLGSLLAPWAGNQIGFEPILYVLAGLYLLIVPLALAYALFHRLAPKSEMPEQPFDPKPILGVAVLLALSLPWLLAQDVVGRIPFLVGTSSQNVGRLYSLNPMVVSATTLFVAAAVGACALMQVRIRAFLLIGIGLLITAVASVPVIVSPSTLAAAGVSFVVLAIGESLVGPALVSRVAAGIHWRFATLAVAIYMTGPALANLVSTVISWSGFHEASISRILLAICAISCAILGAAAIIGHRAFSRFLWPEPETIDPELAKTFD